MTYRIDGKGLVVTFADVVHRRDAHRTEARAHFSRCRITLSTSKSKRRRITRNCRRYAAGVIPARAVNSRRKEAGSL
jgi:hypothetical protein